MVKHCHRHRNPLPSSSHHEFTLLFSLSLLILVLLPHTHALPLPELESEVVQHVPNFKLDYFSYLIPQWSRVHQQIQNLRSTKTKDTDSTPLNYLEVGSFEGRSSTWLLENVLNHPESRLTCIDTWDGSDEHSTEEKEGLYERFLHNIHPYKHKVSVYRGLSGSMLKKPEVWLQQFDFIYIDAGHHSRNALEDAVLSYPLLKVEGIMLFDDYLWGQAGYGDERSSGSMTKHHELTLPKKGIDAFLDIYDGTYLLLDIGYQLMLQKVTNDIAGTGRLHQEEVSQSYARNALS